MSKPEEDPMFRFAALFALVISQIGQPHAQTLEQDIQQLERMSDTFSKVAERVQSGVVSISTERIVSTASPFFNDPFLRRYFRIPRQRRSQQGLGSGVIISPDGYVLTNNHVVTDADLISIELTDGRSYQARIIGADEESDVAVLKVDADKALPTVPVGDSKKLRVGQWVLAIGNPFGLQHTVTYGIISATGRGQAGITDTGDFIQTDAAINPGNSGGALVNLRGELIGINTAILSKSGGYQGIGFAIPVNLAMRIKGQLLEFGEVVPGYLGVSYQTLTKSLAEAFGVGTSSGVLLNSVHEDSPAEKAGLKRGDVIVAIDGGEVKDDGDFQNRIRIAGSDREVKIDYWRGERKRSTRATLEASETTSGFISNRNERLGWELQELSRDLAREYGYRPGSALIITDVTPGKTADQKGLRRGDLILEVNRRRVGTFKELKEILKTVGPGDSLIILVQRGRRSSYVALQMPAE